MKNICKCKKNNKDNEASEFDFPDFLGSEENLMVGEMFHDLIEASNNQIVQAIELTKLITNKSQDAMNADKIFAIFNKS